MNKCPKCSKELSTDVAGGLCPTCLLQQGLESGEEAGETSNPPASEDAGSVLRSPGIGAAAMVGERVGRYKLLQVIGEGGFGVVYMAEQETPVRRRVALKIIKLGMDTKLVMARFEAERQALALMDHPHIAKVFDAGATESGRPYFVMELVNGIPLTTYCDANRLSTEERLALFVPICQAIQHAHQKGIIHRDLKPTNVLVTLHDGKPVPKVIDFGIAKATQSPLTEKTLFTEFHQMIGTPQYMSPEQAEMSGLNIDTRSDVYSLGVMLYELMTGTTPLDPQELRNKAFGEMQRIIREEDPPAPSQRLSTLKTVATVAAQRRTDVRGLSRFVRGELDWIVMKCLEKDRTRRYESASALAADVERYLADEPVSAARPSAIYKMRKFVRRNRLQATAGLVVALSLVVGLGATTYGLIRATSAQRQLMVERDHARQSEIAAEQEREHAQDSARQAEAQLADSLLNQGDALTTTGEYRLAYERFGQAQKILKDHQLSLGRLNLSLARLYRVSPPPLWTTAIPGGRPHAFAIMPSQREMLVAGDDKLMHMVDLVTGAITRTFGDAHEIHCMAVAGTADHPVVVVGSFERAGVLDYVTGATIHEAADDRAMRFVALSPDGKLAASIDQSDGIVFGTFRRCSGWARDGMEKRPRWRSPTTALPWPACVKMSYVDFWRNCCK